MWSFLRISSSSTNRVSGKRAFLNPCKIVSWVRLLAKCLWKDLSDRVCRIVTNVAGSHLLQFKRERSLRYQFSKLIMCRLCSVMYSRPTLILFSSSSFCAKKTISIVSGVYGVFLWLRLGRPELFQLAWFEIRVVFEFRPVRFGSEFRMLWPLRLSGDLGPCEVLECFMSLIFLCKLRYDI